jgi:hypothetical protein
MCPGNNESAGRHFSGRTRKGDRWLRGALGEAAAAAARTKGTYLSARYWRLASRRGKKRATVAIGHDILVAVDLARVTSGGGAVPGELLGLPADDPLGPGRCDVLVGGVAVGDPRVGVSSRDGQGPWPGGRNGQREPGSLYTAGQHAGVVDGVAGAVVRGGGSAQELVDRLDELGEPGGALRRVGAWPPKTSASNPVPPAPTPRVNRPPEMWSSVIASLASVTGCRNVGEATMVPTLIVLVFAANPVSHGIAACQARSRYRRQDRWS